MNKNYKSVKGITLISLVITIIVLLILTTVSISMLLGNNGILTKTQESQELNNKETAKEKVTLLMQELQIAAQLEGSNLEEYVINTMPENIVPLGNNNFKISLDTYQFFITNKREILEYNGESIFDGFLFIGDSITKGLGDSGNIQGANTVFRGVIISTPSNWYNNESIDDISTYSSLPENNDSITNLCVMLGTNNCWNSNINDMKNLLQKLHTDYPNKLIYIQKILPQINQTEPTQNQIIVFNNTIENYCNNYTYLKFIDTTGSIDLSDGVHPSSTGYVTLTNNLKIAILKSKYENKISIFDNFLFIGDSITEQLRTSSQIQGTNINFYTQNNLTPSNFLTELTNETITLPNKNNINNISIMLGSNNIWQYTAMQNVLNKLIELYPNKPIYVHKLFTNPTYPEQSEIYNNSIQTYCENIHNLYFIDATNEVEMTSNQLSLTNNGCIKYIENIKSSINNR